jgi:hypothetical protein
MGCCCFGKPKVMYNKTKSSDSKVILSEIRTIPETIKIELMSASDRQIIQLSKRGLDGNRSGLPIQSSNLPTSKKSLTPVSPLPPGTPKRQRDLMYPSPNCRLTIRTLPSKPKRQTPWTLESLRVSGAPSSSNQLTTNVGLASLVSTDRVNTRLGKPETISILQAKKLDGFAKDIQLSARPRALSFLSPNSREKKSQGNKHLVRQFSSDQQLDVPKIKLIQNTLGSENKGFFESQSACPSTKRLRTKRGSLTPVSNQARLPQRRGSVLQTKRLQPVLELFGNSFWKKRNNSSNPSSNQQGLQAPKIDHDPKIGAEDNKSPQQLSSSIPLPCHPSTPSFRAPKPKDLAVQSQITEIQQQQELNISSIQNLKSDQQPEKSHEQESRPSKPQDCDINPRIQDEREQEIAVDQQTIQMQKDADEDRQQPSGVRSARYGLEVRAKGSVSSPNDEAEGEAAHTQHGTPAKAL